MAFWPFRRKSGRKRSRSGATMSDLQPERGAPPRTQTDDPAGTGGGFERRPSQKKQRTETVNKLHRRDRTFSFDAGRRDSIRVRGAQRVPPPPLPTATRTATEPARPAPGGETGGDSGLWSPRLPTLHDYKRGGREVPRRKSSKRRREDVDREAELKAMSNMMPLRPATDSWTSGRPMKKDSKRVKTGLGFGRENRSSLISLPSAESIRSTMSSDSEMGSYKLGKLEALTPRPTLRYAVYPRWGPPSAGSGPTRTSSQRRKLSERPPIPEATLRAHKRIDELADDLDASDLRELMERDQRRRERQRERDQERMERRLARRAEKQRLAEAAAAASGESPPPNLERGVLGRELVGLGIDASTSAVVTSSKRRPEEMSPKQLGKMPATGSQPEPQLQPSPVRQFHRVDTMPLDTPDTPAAEEKIIEYEPEGPPPPLPAISPRRKLLRMKRSRSRSPPEEIASKPSLDKADDSDAARKASEGSGRSRLSFTTLFKRGKKRGSSGGSSSFANTSREEMQAASTAAAAARAPPPPPQPPAVPAMPANFIPARTLSSGVPKRTMSRFREDLPELPLSPPDSPMRSPDAEGALGMVSEQRSRDNSEQNTPVPMQFGTPTSGQRPADDAMRQTPPSWHRHQEGGQEYSPEPQQSISLASIDSEASWLSGRLAARRSSGLRESLRRYRQHDRTHSGDSTTNNTEEDLAHDDYFVRLSPAHLHGNATSHPAEPAHASSDEDEPANDDDDEADEKWGSVRARQQPTMLHAHQGRNPELMKSREGLLNTFDEDEGEANDESDVDKPDAEEAEDVDVVGDKLEDAGLQRATSVNLGRGHVRRISAGSAKLLELSPRASVEHRRSSEGRRSSGLAFL